MPGSSAKRMKHYRERKRAAGLREVRIWVPDRRDPAFAAEARRQSLKAAASEAEADILAWLEAVQSETELPPYDFGPDEAR